MGPEFQRGERKSFWRWVVVTIAQQCELLNITEMVSFTLGIFYHNFFKSCARDMWDHRKSY